MYKLVSLVLIFIFTIGGQMQQSLHGMVRFNEP